LGLAFGACIVSGCGLETSGFVLRIVPDGGAPPRPDASVVDGEREAGCRVCARTVSLNDDMSTSQPGGDSGAFASDVCPEGEAVIGYHGSLDSNDLGVNGNSITVVGSIETVCGRLVVPDPSATRVTILPGTTFPPHPNVPSTWHALCPADKAVVGFVGGSGDAFDKVAFQCTQLLIAKTPMGDVISPDTSTVQVLPPNGGDAGTFFQAGCAPSKIARGTNVRTASLARDGGVGEWVVAFGLTCATPVLETVDAGTPCCAASAAGATEGDLPAIDDDHG
jgi:hypothetical protein